MKKLFFIIACCLLVVDLKAQSLSTEQLQQDFQIFKAALTEAHPGLYRFETPEVVQKRFAEVQASLTEPLSPQEFYQKLSPVVAGIHCGHTKFHPAGIYDEAHVYHYFYGTERLFPLRMYFSDRKAYLLGSYVEDNTLAKGAEVTAINGRPMPELIDFMFRNIVADGRVESSRYLELNRYFSAYYANLIGSMDTFEVTLKTTGGETRTQSVGAVPLSAIKTWEERQSPSESATFQLQFPQEGVALMTIRAFYPTSKKDDFESFLEKSFEEIRVRKAQKLVLDLRNNEGGIDRWGSLLYSYLVSEPFRYYEELRVPSKKHSFGKYADFPRFYGVLKLLIRKEENGGYRWTKNKNLKVQKLQPEPFTGEVVALINGFSFSVTAEFAAVGKASGRIKFIGEETGGTYSGNNSGTFVLVTLPNSQLMVGIPMMGYYMAIPASQPADRGVLPDIPMSPSVEDVIAGKDVVMEKVLQLTKTN